VLRYASIGDEVQLHTITIPVEVNVTDAEAAKAAGVDTTVVEEVLTLKAAAARKQARLRSRDGDHLGAASVLSDTASELRMMSACMPAPDALLAEADDLDHDRELLDDVSRRHMSSKAMWSKERSMTRKRPTRKDEP